MTTGVSVGNGELHVRFGVWSLTTSLSNVAETSLTGPFSWWKVVGPPRVSMVDRGVTFATCDDVGVCIRFHEPVNAALPFGLVRHPGCTVTVTDSNALRSLLTARR
jgi:hypothetical protein